MPPWERQSMDIAKKLLVARYWGLISRVEILHDTLRIHVLAHVCKPTWMARTVPSVNPTVGYGD